MINQTYATRHGVVAISAGHETITVCFDDPTDQNVIQELTRSTGSRIEVVTASHGAVARALVRLYGDIVPTIAVNTLTLVADDDAERRKSRYTEHPRRKKTADAIVRRLLTAALDSRATDIHRETLVTRLQVRFRIDGILKAFETFHYAHLA